MPKTIIGTGIVAREVATSEVPTPSPSPEARLTHIEAVAKRKLIESGHDLEYLDYDRSVREGTEEDYARRLLGVCAFVRATSGDDKLNFMFELGQLVTEAQIKAKWQHPADVGVALGKRANKAAYAKRAKADTRASQIAAAYSRLRKQNPRWSTKRLLIEVCEECGVSENTVRKAIDQRNRDAS